MQKKRLSIEECDSLMATRSADASGAVWIHAYEEPFELTGFPWFAQDHLYRRLPVTPAHKITPAVDSLAWCTAGCKVRFRTNSSRILLRVKLQDNEIMDHMPRTGSNGFDLYTGAPGKEVYYYTTRANDAGYDFEIFRNPRRKCETITIHFPLYKGVDSLQIGVDNDAKVLPPEPYKEGYIAVYPPSTGRLTPVTYVVAGEARKQIAVSSSPSLPYLSRGIIVLALAWKKSESNVSFVRGL